LPEHIKEIYFSQI